MLLSGMTMTGGFNFSVPPLSTDPTLLMHLDGTNGSNVFTNSSCFSLPFLQDPNASPKATLTTSNFKFGTASLDTGYLPDPGNRGLGIGGIYTDSGTGVGGALDIWPGDFTIEGWLYSSLVVHGLATSRIYFDYSGSDWGVRLQIGPSGDNIFVNPIATSGSGGNGAISGMIATKNTWNHVAIVRYGTAVNLYLNGVKDGGSRTQTGAWTGIARPTQFWIGSKPNSYDGNQRDAWEGYIDEFRVTKSAVYTANFTPPTAPFPNPVCE